MHQMKVALWVMHHNQPFVIVEDEECLDIFHNLNNKFVIPLASTVSCDMEIFQMSRGKVAEMLQVRFTTLSVSSHQNFPFS
jgi:hypothetical protein